MLDIIQNSEIQPLLVQLSLLVVLVAGWAIVFVLFLKTAIEYVNGRADGRTPSLFAFTTAFFVSVVWYACVVFSGHAMYETTLLPRLLFFFFITQCLRGRLIGFPSTKMTKSTRLMYYVTLDILNVLMTLIVLANYDHTFASYDAVTFPIIEESLRALTSIRSGNDAMRLVSFIVSMASLFCAFLVIAFDAVEKRSKRTIKYDAVCFFFPTLAFLAMNYIKFPTPFFKAIVSLTVVVISVFMMIFYLRKERKSILRRATTIDANVRLIDEAIERLAVNGNSSGTKKVIFSTVVGILAKNKSTQNIIFKKKYPKHKEAVVRQIAAELKVEI